MKKSFGVAMALLVSLPACDNSGRDSRVGHDGTGVRALEGTNADEDCRRRFTQEASGAFAFASHDSRVPMSANDRTSRHLFPIGDGTMYKAPFGNQGNTHDYPFTVELHTTF